MQVRKISVINVRRLSGDENRDGNNKEQNELSLRDVCKGLFVSITGTIAFCALFSIPWTTIPRTNSMIYQSHWMMILLPIASNTLLTAGNLLLDLIIWTKEDCLKSLRVFLKTYFLGLFIFYAFYVACYVIWSVYLQNNHPCPIYGLIILPTLISIVSGFWFILPSPLLLNGSFRRKLRWYMLYHILVFITLIFQQVLSDLYRTVPSQFQFLMAIAIFGFREVDKRLRSKVITKMMGQQDEQASIFLAIRVLSRYSFFFTISLVGSHLATMITTIGMGLYFHSKATYQTIRAHRNVGNGGGNSERTEKNITKLIIAELIEGFTPVIYGICIAMAYYGPNAHLLSTIGNAYWSKPMKNIGPVFITMLILFAIDTLSVVINSYLIWKFTNVNMVQSFCRVLSKYWFMLAMTLGMSMIKLFSGKDINFGSDKSKRYFWASHDGWVELVENSTDLTEVEKFRLLGNTSLI